MTVGAERVPCMSLGDLEVVGEECGDLNHYECPRGANNSADAV